jgi:methylated-DNA-[protein]-cysteine S-methyltransferase
MPFIIQWVENCTGVEEIIYLDAPAGKLAVTSRSGVICKTDWDFSEDSIHFNQSELGQQLDRFWMNLQKPVNLKLLKQGTPFRNTVWTELCRIPFGATITYSALARKIGSAPRAVGNACRDNPFPLLIPCHRVVSVSGLGGYNGATAGDFMTIKDQLLEFEAKHKQ